jgi:hypothetical protein
VLAEKESLRFDATPRDSKRATEAAHLARFNRPRLETFGFTCVNAFEASDKALISCVGNSRNYFYLSRNFFFGLRKFLRANK